MKQIIKALRTMGVIMLIVIACFGLGLVGGVPIPVQRRRENNIELRIELKEQEPINAEELKFEKRE